jgi:ABC-2 type transport system permease protein
MGGSGAMSTQSNAVSDSFDRQRLERQRAEPAAATRPFLWSVRRELWENRAIYIAPLTVGGVVLLGSLISLRGIQYMYYKSGAGPAHHRDMSGAPYDFAAGAIMVTAMIVGIFYALETLHGERRDRSILFWKSLPVSDLATVLAKASVIAILQLIAFAVTVATQLVMLLLFSFAATKSGTSVATSWSEVSPLQMWAMLLYHLVTVHTLWHAPLYGYLMLVSSWARRAAILWAGLPVVAIITVEKIAFGTTYFLNLLIYRLAGPEDFSFSMNRFHSTGVGPVHFFATPGLWTGLLVTAGLLFAAARVRRYRDPM